MPKPPEHVGKGDHPPDIVASQRHLGTKAPSALALAAARWPCRSRPVWPRWAGHKPNRRRRREASPGKQRQPCAIGGTSPRSMDRRVCPADVVRVLGFDLGAARFRNGTEDCRDTIGVRPAVEVCSGHGCQVLDASTSSAVASASRASAASLAVASASSTSPRAISAYARFRRVTPRKRRASAPTCVEAIRPSCSIASPSDLSRVASIAATIAVAMTPNRASRRSLQTQSDAVRRIGIAQRQVHSHQVGEGKGLVLAVHRGDGDCPLGSLRGLTCPARLQGNPRADDGPPCRVLATSARWVDVLLKRVDEAVVA